MTDDEVTAAIHRVQKGEMEQLTDAELKACIRRCFANAAGQVPSLQMGMMLINERDQRTAGRMILVGTIAAVAAVVVGVVQIFVSISSGK